MAFPAREVITPDKTLRAIHAETPQDVAVEEMGTLPDPPAEAPDGGFRAWLQVVGSWLVFFNVWGFPFSFGVFQNYYELDLLQHISPSTISWIGTISSFLLIFIGTVSGPLFDLGYYRVMLYGGATMSVFGVMMLSLSTEYYQMLLTQGICLGLGSGVLYLPGLALVSRSFKKRRSVALGLVTCGAPTGGIIYTIIFEQLLDRMGFAWTVRIMGFVMLGSYLMAFPLMLWGATNTGDIASGQARKLFDKGALKDLAFWCYVFANFFIFCGYLVPFFFMANYAQITLGLSRSVALYSLVLAQGVSIGGRLIAAFAAVRVGVMVCWITCGLSSAILCLAWIAVDSRASFLAFAGLYGGLSGALIPLPPSIFPVVCPDPKVLGARMGMAQAIGSIASLVGSPIAGALIGGRGGDATGTSYLGLQLFSGLVMIFGTFQLVALWVILVRARKSKIMI